MRPLRKEYLIGLQYLETATTLLHRIRTTHPTNGLYEAADLQWWWRMPRSTDALRQLFWFDDLNRPEAAMIVTDWGDRTSLNPIMMPDVTPDWVAHVVAHGLTHADELGFDDFGLEVDRADEVLREVLVDHGFVGEEDDGLIEAWLSVRAPPEIGRLPKGYQLSSRLLTMNQLHHMSQRNGLDVEKRLRQTSLYRPDLDLLVLDRHDNVAAYGLFWFDPETATGLVEPMRTHESHQRRGLARHVLTAGIDLLARAGARRIKICFAQNNQAAKRLYLGVGFEPIRQTVSFSRRAPAPTHRLSR